MKITDRVVLLEKISGAEDIAVGSPGTVAYIYSSFEDQTNFARMGLISGGGGNQTKPVGFTVDFDMRDERGKLTTRRAFVSATKVTEMTAR